MKPILLFLLVSVASAGPIAILNEVLVVYDNDSIKTEHWDLVEIQNGVSVSKGDFVVMYDVQHINDTACMSNVSAYRVISEEVFDNGDVISVMEPL